MMFTPPASAALQSPVASARHAWCIATRDEEHAVSRTMEGPPRPNAYDIRPLRKAGRVPVEVSERAGQMYVSAGVTGAIVYIHVVPQILHVVVGSYTDE